jgi:NADH dehydrogenase
MATKRQVVILGGGFAGISAAKALSKSSDIEITLVDKTNHHLFQPLLYQVATAALSPGDIAIPIRSIFSSTPSVKVLMGNVIGISPAGNNVTLEDGRTLSYDDLIVAVGAQYSYFGNDEWKDHSDTLKTLPDALDLREQILASFEHAEQIDDPEERKPYTTFAVVGGGPTGVEMAGAIAEISSRTLMKDFRSLNSEDVSIYLIEAADRILNGYPEHLSDYAHRTLESMGVNVWVNHPVKEMDERKIVAAEKTLFADNIVWAAGVVASPLLEQLPGERDRGGRIHVDDHLRLPDHPEIFVLGDAALALDEQQKPLPALAPVALQQGRYVGRMIRQYPDPRQRSQYKTFRYIDKGTMSTIGRAKAVASIGGFTFTGLFAWLIWSFVHIFFLIGFRNRFRVMAEWIWYYFTFKRGVRLITRRTPPVILHDPQNQTSESSE